MEKVPDPLIHEEGSGDVSQSLEVVDNRPPSHSPPSRSFHPFAIARVYWLVMLKKNGGGGRAVFAFRFVERGIKVLIKQIQNRKCPPFSHLCVQ